MRTDAAGQSPLLMIDVAELLSARGIPYAVIGAMAAAVHGVVRASLDADALVGTQLAVARELQREFSGKGDDNRPRHLAGAFQNAAVAH
jgi:hypothetical protein